MPRKNRRNGRRRPQADERLFRLERRVDDLEDALLRDDEPREIVQGVVVMVGTEITILDPPVEWEKT